MKEKDKLKVLEKSLEIIKNKSNNEQIKKMIKITKEQEENEEEKMNRLSRECFKEYTKKNKKVM